MGMAWTENLLDAHQFGDAPLLSRQPLPDEYEQAVRLAEFCEAHPDVPIGQTGDYAQATVPLENGSQTVTRPTWGELLDALDVIIEPAPRLDP